ncbi:MAG TPA: TonB-dependent receptor [Bryobacteraceae bacterium]|jgi:iron complex outermembrane receptor protein|nr:TonB-dependent receptor [Bryobacteraceae bacterium]
MKGVSGRLTSIAISLIAGMVPLYAQIAGTVLDQAGKTIQGAEVVVKNDAAVANTTTTDADGRFSATGLSAGSYTVETSAPGFARNVRSGVPTGTQDLSITLNVDSISQSVTVHESVSIATETAPQGNTMDATSARTEISSAFIRNFIAPTSDFAEVVNLAPGTFSLNPNGIGLGQGKTFFRGFSDGQYTITFDGIPFEDTNSPTHHSWASFPSQWISSTDFDRSPGQASDFGPTNFGGSINLKSPELQADPDIRGTFSYGSFNTRIYQLDGDSGTFGPGKKDAVLFDINQMTSDGYQTFNHQQRDAGYAKAQHRFSDKTSLSLYGGVVDIWNNTPNTTNPLRSQVAQFGDNYLLDNTPLLTNGTPDPYYYKYFDYHVQTDFEYADFNSDLGDGWRFDTKAYTTRYWNKQFYQNGATVSLSSATPSGVDKLNGYRHAGDTLVLSKESKWGVFRGGVWYDWAYTDRYQYPSNILSQQDTPLGNFHEHFTTQTFQPFAEYQWRATQRLAITAGIKSADYQMRLNQYQDSATVGCLGGVSAKDPVTGAPICVGGAAFTTHKVNYNSWLPTITAREQVLGNWSVYGQFAEGSVIPPSNVFDVTGGIVLTPPKPTIAKTYQAGSVLKFNRFTLDTDAYYVHFQNGYSSYVDPATNEPVFVATGPSNTKGIEAESNIAIGWGLSLYVNTSFGSAKYQEGKNFPNGGLWVANTPNNVQGMSLLWQHKNFDFGLTNKRVGRYYNDNKTLSYTINGIKVPVPVDQAVTINPFDLTNLFFNYTVKNSSFMRGSKIAFAVNNLFDKHNLVGVTPGVSPTLAAPYVQSPNDQLNLLPGRSFSITVTGGYAPKR